MSSYNNYIIFSNNYNHLSDFERGKIKALLEEGKSIRYISQKLNRNVSTVSRELKRNTISQIKTANKKKVLFNIYDPYAATALYKNRRKKSVKKCILDRFPSLKAIIESSIKVDKYSPEIISKSLSKKGFHISFKTIYNYADSKKLSINKVDFRFRARRKYKVLLDSKEETKYTIPAEKRICNRPEYINDRSQFGHWEGDLVIGLNKTNSFHLLTLVERQTLSTIILKVHGKCQTAAIGAIDKLEQYYKEKFKYIFKSITFDNGCEFRNYNKLEQSIIDSNNIRTNIYYGEPYKSNDRALNENTNGLIRIHFPKGTNFNNISEGKIQEIEDWINNRPRKTLNFNISKNLFIQNISCI